jgi:hypothetical protein
MLHGIVETTHGEWYDHKDLARAITDAGLTFVEYVDSFFPGDFNPDFREVHVLLNGDHKRTFEEQGHIDIDLGGGHILSLESAEHTSNQLATLLGGK